MHPFERTKPGPPPGVKPVLHVVLKEGWRLARGRRSFVSSQGRTHPLKRVLPTGASVVSVAPALANAAPESLTDEERDLARHVQVIFPEGSDPSAYADALRGVEPVEEVRVPPQIALP